MSGFIVTVVPVRDLIGAEVFRNMLFGRYHRPLEEERIFLFIDLTGCTAYAQAHGDRQAQTYLGAFLATTPQSLTHNDLSLFKPLRFCVSAA